MKPIPLLLALTCTGFISTYTDTTFASSTANQTTDLYQNARTEKNPEAALKLFDRLVQIDPATYQGERGKHLAGMGLEKEALEDLDEAVHMDPNLWLPARALFQSGRGNFPQALGDCDTLIAIRRERLQNTATATRAQFRAKVRLASGYAIRADVFERKHDLVHSRQDLEMAAEFDPERYLTSYADFCERNHFNDGFLEALNRLVSLYPTRFLVRRATYFEKNKQFDDAIRDLDTFVATAPKLSRSDQYSPLSWALKERAAFFSRHGQKDLEKRDLALSKKYEAIQQRRYGRNFFPTH